ncbi:MAG: response regulator, partial [Bradyrhizobium sp.]|nr:response regulator [Bradyrhizobium sp.]
MYPILIVEDEYFIADDCVSEVRKRGLKALAVGNLEDALELAQTAELEGALVGLDLRKKSALSIVELLRQR